jgi:PhnB protein
MTSIQPELWVDRAGAAIAFYQEAFGSRVMHRVADGDDIIAQLSVGDAAVWLTLRAQK